MRVRILRFEISLMRLWDRRIYERVIFLLLIKY